MASWLGQGISKMTGLVGCSRCAVIGTCQKESKKGQAVNQQQDNGRPWHSNNTHKVNFHCSTYKVFALKRAHIRGGLTTTYAQFNTLYGSHEDFLEWFAKLAVLCVVMQSFAVYVLGSEGVIAAFQSPFQSLPTCRTPHLHRGGPVLTPGGNRAASSYSHGLISK